MLENTEKQIKSSKLIS